MVVLLISDDNDVFVTSLPGRGSRLRLKRLRLRRTTVARASFLKVSKEPTIGPLHESRQPWTKRVLRTVILAILLNSITTQRTSTRDTESIVNASMH